MASLVVMRQGIDPRRWRAGRGERGDIAIIAAIVMPIMILALAFGIDIGHMTYVQRNLQKIADMAAIAGAEDIPNAQSLAQDNAVKNGLQTSSSTHITATQGNWNPQIETGPTYFSTAVPYGHQANAVQVQLSESVPYFFFFGPKKTVQAQAIAWVPNPAAGFSISSQVLNLNTQQSALLNGILGGLLGTSLNLSVAGYNALLGTTVSLGQLAQTLNVGTVNHLLSTNLNLPGLYQGALTVLGNQANGGLLNSQNATGALQQIIGSTTNSTNIQLGKILNLGLADKNAAANAQVNLLGLITASAQLANQQHFVDVPGVNVLGLASLKLFIISPPKLAYGEPGQNPDGTWKTQAQTAQVALQLQVLGSLVKVDLQASPAIADLTNVVCTMPQGQSQVGVRAGTGLLTASIGVLAPQTNTPVVLPQNFSNHTFTGLPIPQTASNSGNQPWDIGSTSAGQAPLNLNLNLLGLNLGSLLNGLLNPIVDDLLAPVLKVLGISLGNAKVTYTTLSCGTIPPVLVY